MAEDDIYSNKTIYEKFIGKAGQLIVPPRDARRKYWIKNPENAKYFIQLADKMQAKDLSYIRRIRMLRKLLFICHCTRKDLAELQRDDIDAILSQAHAVNRTYESKRDFLIGIKSIWRTLFPDKDERGRDDETIVPYVVRHVKTKIDRSRQKIRKDKFTADEYMEIFDLFYDRLDVQSVIVLAYEGLARPQEILGRSVKDVELHENYAKIWISERGKEGVGFIPIIEHVDVIRRWMEVHPLRHDPNAPLFFSRATNTRFRRLAPTGFNKIVRRRMKSAGMDKPVTLYSFKRNGITHMRLKGKSDLDIQRRARWTSTEQLHTYDLSTQEDAFQKELERKGLVVGAPRECIRIDTQVESEQTSTIQKHDQNQAMLLATMQLLINQMRSQ